MVLCIPSETNQGKDARCYGHFGSAPFFTLFDTSAGSVEIIDNTNQHHAHGMCHPMAALTGRKLDAVVCAGLGARAVQRLNEAGIKAYRAVQGTVSEVAAQFLNGKLDEITVSNACSQHGCH
jgi:predicted Fe-Mo cluster-binding NifX family protein